MRTGITQEQVNAAADAILGAGENPTVEKVRAELGTGSPNTVTRMLDTWRSGLAERLQKVLHLPELPTERERTAAHLRAVEDRAHQEIDHARQETKQWRQRHEAAERAHRDTAHALEARCATSQKQLQEAEKDVARLSGQVLALETSLAKTSASPKTKRVPRSTGSKITKSIKP